MESTRSLTRLGWLFLSVIAIFISACRIDTIPQRTADAATLTAFVASPSATSTEPAPTLTPDPCSALNLTPEECANQGTHRYSITYEDMNGCETTGVDNVGPRTNSFDQEGVNWRDGQAIRQGPNNFLYVYDPENTTKLIFSLEGFAAEDYWGEILCVRATYELIQ